MAFFNEQNEVAKFGGYNFNLRNWVCADTKSLGDKMMEQVVTEINSVSTVAKAAFAKG